MTARLVFVCALAAGCSRSPDAGPLPGSGYSYLVTPAGRMYRVLKTGGAAGAEGKKLGATVSYAGETRDVARMGSDAEELVAALGPELELSGETAVVVQANVGWDPRKTISTSASYAASFERRDGRWVRLPPKPGEPKELEGALASPAPPDDPAFPFDAAGVRGASDAAAKWVALLDAGDVDGSVAAMSGTFRSQVDGKPEEWRSLVTQHGKLGAAGHRVELYRMQTRNANVPVPAGGAAIVQYELTPPQGGRFLERVILLREKDGWRPAGYSLRPFATR